MFRKFSGVPLQVVNDYERDVFNGDQGFVTGVSPDGALEVTFPPASGGSANGGGSGVAAAGNSSGDGGTSGAANQAAGSGDAGGIATAGAGSQRPPLPRAVQYLGRQVCMRRACSSLRAPDVACTASVCNVAITNS